MNNKKEILDYLNKNINIVDKFQIQFSDLSKELIKDDTKLADTIINKLNIEDKQYLEIILNSIEGKRTTKAITVEKAKIVKRIALMNKKNKQGFIKALKENLIYVQDDILKFIISIISKNISIYTMDDELEVEIIEAPIFCIKKLDRDLLLPASSFKSVYIKKTISALEEEVLSILTLKLLKFKNKLIKKDIDIKDMISNIGDVNELEEIVKIGTRIVLSSKVFLGGTLIKYVSKKGK